MPGPPPTPAERKRRLGNPGRRPLPKLAEVTSLPAAAGAEPPEHLGESGRAVWEVVTGLGWVSESDRVAVTLLCELLDRRNDFVERLEASAPVLFTDKGYAYPNPLVGMLSTLERQIARQLGAIGLTPADRTRMGLAEVRAKSKLEELMEARQRRGPAG